nr:helix-turn-helix transcriptional regulator [Psychrobacillus sp. BL-248-WT-3]
MLRKVKYTLRKVSFTKGRVPVKNYVRDKRMELGLTQDELSEKLEVSRQTIISLEKGKYNPSIQLAFKLSRLFKCYIEDIFIYEGDD